MTRLCCSLALIIALAPSTSRSADEGEGWKSLFDGKTFTGWKMTEENQSSWSIVDGTIKSNGERSHLFYVGDERPFKNFDLRVEVKTDPNSNAGIYFHTKYQATGWPSYGFEAQVNNSFNADPRKTGSLYAVKDVLEAPAKDGVWFTEAIRVEGKNVTIRIDDKVVVDYDEPADLKAGKDFTRKLAEGTFALQAHDPGSTVYFRNIRVRRLE